MSGPPSRLRSILGHLVPSSPSSLGAPEQPTHLNHIHQLSPTLFLERAAAIEPCAEAIYHITANGAVLRRSYEEFADRARGLAYYLVKNGHKRVGILAPNTPAFLESIFGIGAAGAVTVPVNYRLKPDDINYIFEHAEVDSIIVDEEYEDLLKEFREKNPKVHILVDLDTDDVEGELCGPFDDAILEGLNYDHEEGNKGWLGLKGQCEHEDDMLAIPFTSGTTSRPKGVVYTHRGAYLAALANVIESGLNYNIGRCKYLWTLPMFHAMGWTFPWAITAVRGTHICLRKIDYPTIWKILKEEGITHFNAAPTVNTLLCAAKEAEKLPNPVRVTVAASPPTAHLFEQMVCADEKSADTTRAGTAGPRPPFSRPPPSANDTYGNITGANGIGTPGSESGLNDIDNWIGDDSDDLSAVNTEEAKELMANPYKLFLKQMSLNLYPVHVYGMTETYGPITKGYHMPEWETLPTHEKFGRMARQGHGFVTSLPARVIRQDKPVGVLEDVKMDGKEIGEIVFFGNICCKEYYRDAEATTKLFEGGCLHSGDLAVKHPDGSIQILDRSKDIIISGGENISSVALESMLAEHPDLLEVGVVSVPDSHWGERPKAYITVKEGKTVHGPDLISWAKGHRSISRFMVPREVEVVKELPKTSTGKIRKNVLREWAKAGHHTSH
ncbi:2-succinylbenzoate-CoA ligase [Zalerion maritima]|uniref:2-succinylbenzoate-CoA ligase n=1 Tax=Zalerion maritima TaxID=339359 RepID=A0AAD5S4M1_9PEZI|nr:2-succinylbenzoate-CoA ligase [Zalerion maritima]